MCSQSLGPAIHLQLVLAIRSLELRDAIHGTTNDEHNVGLDLGLDAGYSFWEYPIGGRGE
jgi:hypothetical protein